MISKKLLTAAAICIIIVCFVSVAGCTGGYTSDIDSSFNDEVDDVKITLSLSPMTPLGYANVILMASDYGSNLKSFDVEVTVYDSKKNKLGTAHFTSSDTKSLVNIGSVSLKKSVQIPKDAGFNLLMSYTAHVNR